MRRSMMEMANTSLSHDEVGQLVDQMFVSSGLERSSSLRFKDFARVVNDKMDMLWDVCLDWKGTLQIQRRFSARESQIKLERLSNQSTFTAFVFEK